MTDPTIDWDAVPQGIDPDALAEAKAEFTWTGYDGDDQPVGDDGTWLNSTRLIEWVRERSPKVMIGFSMGKDSIATMYRLRDYWDADDITAFHLYTTPNLGFEARALDYYRKWFGVRVLHLPHRSLFRYLNDGVFQPPHHLPVIWGAGLPDLGYPDIYWLIANYVGIAQERPWVAQGVRSADSPMRRMLLKRHGPWRRNERVFMPIHDWYERDIHDLLKRTGIKLPVDYRIFGRTYDGLDHRFADPLREHFPEDYERVAALFPFMDLERWRRGGPKPDERD